MQRKSAGARVRRLRERRALTQEQLAEAAGIAVRTVQRAEDGALSAETVAALAAALEVPVETLTAAGQSGDYPQITPMLFYSDAGSLDWLARAFGLTERMRHLSPDGRIAHVEMYLGEGLIMIASPAEPDGSATPSALGGVTTQSLYVMVDDVDEHLARAREHGAKIITGPENAHGHRRYLAEDPEGHRWQFWTALPDPAAPPPHTGSRSGYVEKP